MSDNKNDLDIEIIEPSEEYHKQDDRSHRGKTETEHLKIKYSSNMTPAIGTILIPFILLILTVFIVPALGIWIWAKVGFFNAVLFGISYIFCAIVWNWLIGILISFMGGRILGVRALIYVTVTLIGMSVLVNIFLPWILAGLYLGWLR